MKPYFMLQKGISSMIHEAQFTALARGICLYNRVDGFTCELRLEDLNREEQ
jgi:hypothetical protein